MSASLRLGAISVLAATAIGVTAGTANAAPAQPVSMPAGTASHVAAPPRRAPALRDVDAAQDYLNGLPGQYALQQAHSQAAETTGAVIGAALVAPVGCFLGWVGGGFFTLILVGTLPSGCIGGAFLGAMVGYAAGGIYALTTMPEPATEQCDRALPEWRCELLQQEYDDQHPPAQP